MQVWNIKKDQDVIEKFGKELEKLKLLEKNNNVEEDIPECSVDLDGGVGGEDESNYLEGIVDDYLPTSKKARKE